MKKIVLFFFSWILISSFSKPVYQDQVTGAWEKASGDKKEVIVFEDGYFMHSVFTAKEFGSTRGGTYRFDNGKLIFNVEFDTKSRETIGTEESHVFTINSNGNADFNGTWKRLDKGTGDLAGNWRITGRKQGDKMSQMQTGPRKTLKILSGTRFQWAAINTDTKEFFGTGGGTYTFENGNYTENIDFFSRDNSRVGASLSFKGEVKGNEWHHSGLSSKGDPIYEIWTREEIKN